MSTIPPQIEIDGPVATSPSSATARVSVQGLVALATVHGLVDCYGGFWAILKHKSLANLDLARAGQIATIATFLGTILQPVFGHFADSGHHRLLVLLGFALTSVGMLTGPVAFRMDPTQPQTYLVLGLMLLMVRVGQAIFHPAGTAIAGNSHVGKRSTIVAFFITGGMIGFAASQRLYSYVYLATDGNTWLLLIPGLLAMAWFAIACPSNGKVKKQTSSWRTLHNDLRHVRWPMLALYLTQVASSGVMMGLIFLLPELLTIRHYPTWMVQGGGMAFLIGGSVLLMVPAAHFADRFGQRRTILISLIGTAITYYAMVGLPALPTAVFAGLCLLAGGMLSIAAPIAIAYGQALVPHRSSLISGLLMGLAWALGSTTPMLVGFLAKQEDIGVILALQILGILTLLSPWCVLALLKHSATPSKVPSEHE